VHFGSFSNYKVFSPEREFFRDNINIISEEATGANNESRIETIATYPITTEYCKQIIEAKFRYQNSVIGVTTWQNYFYVRFKTASIIDAHVHLVIISIEFTIKVINI